VTLRNLGGVIATALFLEACAGASTSPSAVARPVTEADLVGVAKQVFVSSARFYGFYVACVANNQVPPCPITSRLKARLTQAKITLCQCEYPAPSLEVTATPTASGGIAHVVLGYQPNPIKMDLVIVQDSGKLLVDDELCTDGGPSTSIYVRTGGCGAAAD
jgi:hypothetical protein